MQENQQNKIYFNYSVPNGVVSELVLNSREGFSNTNRPVFVKDDVYDGYEKYLGCAMQNPPTCRNRKDRFMKQSVHISGSPSSIKENSSLGFSDCHSICRYDYSCTTCNTIYTNRNGCWFGVQNLHKLT